MGSWGQPGERESVPWASSHPLPRSPHLQRAAGSRRYSACWTWAVGLPQHPVVVPISQMTKLRQRRVRKFMRSHGREGPGCARESGAECLDSAIVDWHCNARNGQHIPICQLGDAERASSISLRCCGTRRAVLGMGLSTAGEPLSPLWASWLQSPCSGTLRGASPPVAASFHLSLHLDPLFSPLQPEADQPAQASLIPGP